MIKRISSSAQYNKFIFLLFFGMTADAYSNVHFANPTSTIKLTSSNAKLVLDTELNIAGTLSLRDNSTNTVSGSNINFVGGTLQSGNLSTNLTAIYNTTGTDSIILGGNSFLDAQSGSINVPIYVTGNNNSILGRIFLIQPITLADNNASLNVSIQTNLSKNVNLNSGTLNLSSDLKLADDVNITGPGTIAFNGNQLGFGVSALMCNTDLTMINDANISLSSNITLDNCFWDFADDGGVSIIHGNGNTINLVSNSQIKVGPNHTLFLNNVFIKGLGDDLGAGKIIFYNDTSSIKMREVTLDMISDYSINQGQMFVQDSSCHIITKNFLFYINNNAILTIDGVALIWDKLNLNNDNDPVIPATTNNLNLINGGFIRNINTTLQPTFIYETSFSSSSNIDLTTASALVFSNDTPTTPKTVFINGNGHYIHFSRDDTFKNFILHDNVQLTLANFVLKDFNPNIIQLGANSTLTFGDDVTIELGKDIALSNHFYYEGNITINGKGAVLTLQHNDSLVLTMADKNLTLQNLILKGIGGTNTPSGVGRLRMNYSSDSITLHNVDIYLDDNYKMSNGAFNFDGNIKFIGKDHKLIYASGQQSTIFTKTALIFDRGVTFSYAADVGVLSENGTQATYTNSRNRIRMIDSTSIMYLDGATIHSTHTGLVLNTGTLVIGDHSIIRSVAAIDEGIYGHGAPPLGEEPVLGANLSIKVLASAVFDVQGRVVYD